MACGMTAYLCSAEPEAGSTNAAPAKVQAKKLTGAELYAINCNRCHPERYPTEFNSAQWKTLLTHMRVRANLPAKQAKEILKYLQEESGN
jgi:mono/diheme cytochrome c family protein